MMSFVRPLARAYSSFFSSKPGGGRLVKPPKSVLHHRRQPQDNSDSTTATHDHPSPSTRPVEAPQLPFPVPLLAHPTLSSKEYKLHQFFSLHRPLLLLNQPTSAIFEPTDPATPLSVPLGDQHNTFATIDNPPESSPDSDADAARHLAHTLVMNRVGGAVAWQRTLSRLGLTDEHSADDMVSSKETAHEWVTIHADSTRRKKRKKMKKHKLKKRRRLTRRQSK